MPRKANHGYNETDSLNEASKPMGRPVVLWKANYYIYPMPTYMSHVIVFTLNLKLILVQDKVQESNPKEKRPSPVFWFQQQKPKVSINESTGSLRWTGLLKASDWRTPGAQPTITVHN